MSKTKIILYVVLLLAGIGCQAQTIDSLNVDKDMTLTLPPLDTLFKWAEANSPQIHEQLALMEKTDADAKHIKKLWMDAIKFTSTAQDGNFGDPVINKLSFGYSAGLSVSFSLYQVAGFRNLMKVYKAENKVAATKKEQSEFDTRKMVIILYNNIIGQRNILKIRSDATQAAYTHVKMAEKEFKEGTVAVGELSRVTEIYTKSMVDYEVGYNDLKNYYMELELMIGRKLDNQ